MKKKGQILGVPLVLLFGLIVGALILAYGAKVVLDMLDEAEYVDFLDTLDDIENNVETFSHYDEGSSKVYTLDLPQSIETLCFYDADEDFEFFEDFDSFLSGTNIIPLNSDDYCWIKMTEFSGDDYCENISSEEGKEACLLLVI